MSKDLIIIPDQVNYTPAIGHLVAQMHFTRDKTAEVVRHLTMDQLDFNFDRISNSIGTLLKHIAANERYFQIRQFEQRSWGPNELDFWGDALQGQLYLRRIHGRDSRFYLELLEKVRMTTLEALRHLGDDWLMTNSVSRRSGSKKNNYFCLFHLLEDEISHLGQIKMTINRFPADADSLPR
jgi:hypothetical protein